ncbi:thiosulfate sulfurtransferase GlpE [Pseudomonas sp. DTU_2021_1001937_2_SI_NGA_ILE_001]|uniref:thiosulfate sulfurtransferase GlpE n=1 Tax=Pseudomonas sp. DTU_2021_1001937_2_SI_NGA_ILE_001 TaxID=3077589 RepID=UPI0025F01BAC|nr:thiosulfate sulfurtransferase GlpE [Pseudomonas sp. DTU_2021_1001937_2_SI_NGA_ILE_001]WNW12150.1 thiosulfate sulfurtransferase GlpE [Pseudomonas sp. DTU_2021_1001937_2_SI_NGA_ILE_001]
MTDFKRISAEQAHTLREQGAVLVDIRDPQTFAGSHISGARHLDNHSLAGFIADTEPSQPVIVVCYHGNSSQNAAAYLASQGFTDVYSLDGGFEAWRGHYPNETEQG